MCRTRTQIPAVQAGLYSGVKEEQGTKKKGKEADE
jgi:hypothetical protein